MTSYITFGSSVEQITAKYPDFQPLFKWGHQISTQLPKNIAKIRAVAVATISCLVALILNSRFLSLPIVTVGLAFAGWTIYSHILSKDPLLEAFYKIFGGKNEFEKLPKIKIVLSSELKEEVSEKPKLFDFERHSKSKKVVPGSDSDICQGIMKMKWDDLKHPISISSTLDGRRIILVKGSNYKEERILDQIELTHLKEEITTKTTTNTIFAYIEKVNEARSDIAIGHAIIGLNQGNTFFCNQRAFTDTTVHGIRTVKISDCKITSSISTDMANEIAAQWQNEIYLDWK